MRAAAGAAVVVVEAREEHGDVLDELERLNQKAAEGIVQLAAAQGETEALLDAAEERHR